MQDPRDQDGARESLPHRRTCVCSWAGHVPLTWWIALAEGGGMEQNHISWQACSSSTGATGCAGTETTTPPCKQVPAHISLLLQKPQASTRHTPITQMRRPRWQVDICPSLSKFTVDFTQGRKAPHSQHGDLPLARKFSPSWPCRQ